MLALFFDTLRNTLTGALRGLYDTRMTMFIAILSLWIIRMPLAYLFGFYWHAGIVGTILLWLRWRKKLQSFTHVSLPPIN